MPEYLMDDRAELAEKRRLRLVLHGRTAKFPSLREAIEIIREAGVSVDVRVTWEAGDAARFAREAVEDAVDVVVAGGGDGTLNEVAGGMLAGESSPRTALAVMPLGTANDFAAASGLSAATPLEALKLAAGGRVRLMDVGRMNGRYFVNVVSGGFGAEVTANTPDEMKQLLGGAAYSLMGLLTAINYRPYEARLTMEDHLQEGNLLLVAVGNGRQCGGGYQVTPKALLNDGLLDLVLVRDAEFPRWGAVYHEMTNPDLEDRQFVDYYQFKSFTLETREPFQMNLDGEPVEATRFEFEIAESRLPVILPAGSPLMSEAGESPRGR